MSDRSTFPDTDLSSSSFGVAAVVTLPLMVSARTDSLHASYRDVARYRSGFYRHTGRHDDRVVHAHPVIPIPRRVRRPHVDASGTLVDVDPDARELARTAARPLDGVDRHLVSRSTGDDNVPGDVDDAEPPVAADLDPPGKALGLFRSAAPLIRSGYGPIGPLDGPLHRALDGLLESGRLSAAPAAPARSRCRPRGPRRAARV